MREKECQKLIRRKKNLLLAKETRQRGKKHWRDGHKTTATEGGGKSTGGYGSSGKEKSIGGLAMVTTKNALKNCTIL